MKITRNDYKIILPDDTIPNLMAEITGKWMGLHENLVKHILRKILNREPIPEDAKELSFIFMQDIEDKKDLAYKGEKIGTIVNNYGYSDGRMGFVFYPTEKFSFLADLPPITP